ncbi:uncharacterized protein LOC130195746 isoform X1 [Pseudoliparis swirei]|uniref:uncharacterized protein LOC130195746 isoform X1 n=1 Tax=Pseudoliparis swirei TaxID=2059687 RepID=UPI0024BE3150|nr:uncharacterized protein LOC130195746 isoform X1 [Pseudoliparis swirei]
MLLPLLCAWLCSEAAATQLHRHTPETTFSPHRGATAADGNAQSRRWRTVTGEDNGGTRGASAQSSWLDSVDPASSDLLGTQMPRRAARKSDAPNGARRARQLLSGEGALRADVNQAGSGGCRPGDALRRACRLGRSGRGRRRRRKRNDGAAVAQGQEAGPAFGLTNGSDYEEEDPPPDATPLAPLNPRTTRRKRLHNPFYPLTAGAVGAYAVAIAAAVLFGVGVIGNVSVMCIVCHNYDMRSVSNSLLANLALWDFVVIFFCLPLVVFRELTGDWLLGDFSCRIIPYLEFPPSPPGGVSGGHDLHTLRPVHRPLPRRRRRASVPRDDGELGVDRGQAGHHLGRRSAAGAARAADPPAGERGRRPGGGAVRALRGPHLHRPPGHAVRARPHVRRRPPLVALRLLLLPPDALHHRQLAGHGAQDPERRPRRRRPRADPSGEPDELRRGGAGHPLRLLHHPGEHLQRGGRLHGGRRPPEDAGRTAADQPDVPLLQVGGGAGAAVLPEPAVQRRADGLLLLLLRRERRGAARAARRPRRRGRRRRRVRRRRAGAVALQHHQQGGVRLLRGDTLLRSKEVKGQPRRGGGGVSTDGRREHGRFQLTALKRSVILSPFWLS